MDIRSCEVFLSLAETRHFGQTASRCHSSPSAVSRQLKRLEADVGRKLLDRDSRTVRLTPAGRHFLEYARKAVDDWRQLKAELGNDRSELSGEISVFGSVTASYTMLEQILPAMRDTYPRIEIKLRTGDQADGIERVMDGSEDCAIVAAPDELPDRLQLLPMRQTPLRLIGPMIPSALTRQLDRCLADERDPDWSDIPMILAERGLARERLLARLGQLGQSPAIYATVAGHEAVVAMVSLGFGVAVVPELVIQHSPKRDTVRVLPWLSDLPPFALGLCALKSRLRDPLLKALWDCALHSHRT